MPPQWVCSDESGADARITNLAVDNARIQGSPGDIAVGALVGINSGHVEACYATGPVAGSDKVGGLCGENRGEIRNCYAGASVSGQHYVGGLIGWNGGISSRTTRRDVAANAANGVNVTNCYATGAVSASANAGGLIGGGIGMVQACFWDVETADKRPASQAPDCRRSR